jgi:hypothetical protein
MTNITGKRKRTNFDPDLARKTNEEYRDSTPEVPFQETLEGKVESVHLGSVPCFGSEWKPFKDTFVSKVKTQGEIWFVTNNTFVAKCDNEPISWDPYENGIITAYRPTLSLKVIYTAHNFQKQEPTEICRKISNNRWEIFKNGIVVAGEGSENSLIHYKDDGTSETLMKFGNKNGGAIKEFKVYSEGIIVEQLPIISVLSNNNQTVLRNNGNFDQWMHYKNGAVIEKGHQITIYNAIAKKESAFYLPRVNWSTYDHGVIVRTSEQNKIGHIHAYKEDGADSRLYDGNLKNFKCYKNGVIVETYENKLIACFDDGNKVDVCEKQEDRWEVCSDGIIAEKPTREKIEMIKYKIK